eukprot:m.180891 g.180891  ORF g.180891 m.180891 type:complete len:53 (-) comp16864_c1_seq1:125-283(-)
MRMQVHENKDFRWLAETVRTCNPPMPTHLASAAGHAPRPQWTIEPLAALQLR